MNNSKRVSKPQIAQLLQNLLSNFTFQTQEEICSALKERGHAANQVMVSRLLNQLGAIKVNRGDKIVYQLTNEYRAVTPNHTLKHLIINIMKNESLVVIKTTPGSAQLVAGLLDQASLAILGTVAGDDTIFIAPESTRNLQALYDAIRDDLLV